MGRNGKRIKRIFVIINIIIAVTISYFIYNKYQENNDKTKELNTIKEKYKVLLNDNDIDSEEIKEINDKINDIENINNKIKEKQKEVFNLASNFLGFS